MEKQEESQEKEILSPEEFAILEFTNCGDYFGVEFKEPYNVILTGKESYFWAVALAIAISRYDNIDGDSIEQSYERVLNKNKNLLQKKYYPEKLGYFSDEIDQELFETLIQDFLYELGCSDLHLNEIIQRTQKSYYSLIKKNLIEDPIEITAGAVTVAVIGFLPYGFTTRTRKGRVVYRKITAGWWDYESEFKNGVKTTKINIRLARYLKRLKLSLIEASQNTIDEP